MRPSIEVPTKYGFLDLVQRIPRSIFGFQNVVSELARGAIGWRAISIAFLALCSFSVFETLVREWIAPELRDSLREQAGELGYATTLFVSFLAFFGLFVGLQWAALRLFRERASWRRVSLAFVASSLPQVPLALVWFAILGAMSACGVDVRFGSTFSHVETAVTLGIMGFYLSWALSAVLDLSLARASLSVVFGPGALMALMLLLSFQGAG